MKSRNKAMAEIIIIGIFTVSAVLAAALAVHNVRELYDVRSGYDEIQKIRNELAASKKILELENEVLTTENNDLADLVASLNEENRVLFNELQKARETPKKQDTVGTSQRENAHLERLPEGIATNRYDCEPYDTFGKNTQQAILQEDCFTEPETGIRYYRDSDGGKYYCAALGGAYGIDIGMTWTVTLQCGTRFNIIYADYQHDISDPDPEDFGERYVYDDNGKIIDVLRNYDGEPVVHVIEFVTDMSVVHKAAIEAGGMHGLEKFGGKYGNGGNIVKLEYLGRKWKP